MVAFLNELVDCSTKDRINLTKQALHSYKKTVALPILVIVTIDGWRRREYRLNAVILIIVGACGWRGYRLAVVVIATRWWNNDDSWWLVDSNDVAYDNNRAIKVDTDREANGAVGFDSTLNFKIIIIVVIK
jgi:hypothetical protein